MDMRLRILACIVAALAVSLTGCIGGGFVDVDHYIRLHRSGPAAEAPPTPADTPTVAAREPSAAVPLMTDVGTPAPVTTADQPTAVAAEGKPVPWSKRRGPAYPGDTLRTFGRDAKEMPATMWDDAKFTFTDPWTLVALAASGVAGYSTHKSMDDRIQDHYRRTGSDLPKLWDDVGDIGGCPGLHFALAGAMYFASLERGDTKGYETSKTLLNALAINGIMNMALKATFHTESPNGEPWGWPSGHTSSTFCLATVMHEAYGPKVGIPLFAFAAFVGYERIDARNHDFSDVVSGAIMGIAIGHAVMSNHEMRIFGMDVIPMIRPEGGAGIALSKRF